MEKHVVIIFYEGEEPSKECLRKAVEAVVNNVKCTAEEIDVRCLNEEEILQAIVGKAVADVDSDNVVRIISKKEPEQTLEESAVVYLKTIIPDDDGIRFASELSSRYVLAIIQGTDEKLVNAVKILGTGHIENISIAVRRKYHFNRAAFDIVKSIYSQCAGHFAK